MYRTFESLWNRWIEVHYYLLKLLFKDELKYNLSIIENTSESED